jgi:hypothetical protein
VADQGRVRHLLQTHYAALNGSRAHHWNFGEMPPVEAIAEPEGTKIVAFVRAVQKANGVE